MAYMDTIKFVNKHIPRIPEIAMPKCKRDEALRGWLVEYHSEKCAANRKVELQNLIVQSVYFLFPYFLKGKYTSSQFIQDDIAQIMVLNTIEAINNYKPEKASKFTSYLVGYLRNAVATAYKNVQVVSSPSYVRRDTIASLEKIACGKPATSADAKPTPKEIDTASTKLSKSFPDALYLEDAPIDKNSIIAKTPLAHGDLPMNAELGMLISEQVHVLGYLLSDTHPTLSKREKLVLKHRFGVFGHDKLTLQEVSERFRMRGWQASKEWVFQLEKRALKKVLAEFKALNF